MSIKSSLRTSILLLASIPVIIMAVLSYIVASNKYVELSKESMKYTANTYREGFEATLSTIISNNELVASNMYIQSFLAEKVNTPNIDLTTSNYFKLAKEQITKANNGLEGQVVFSLYDVDGYYILGTDSNNGDWNEYMEEDVTSIHTTKIYSDAAISTHNNDIEIVTPVLLKDTVVGIIRSSIHSSYFRSFIPEDGDCYIMDSNGNFLFGYDSITKDKYAMETIASLKKSKSNITYGTIFENSGADYIYSYSALQEYNWLYIMRQDRSAYHAIMSSLPLLITVGLIIILLIAAQVSNYLAKVFASPIMKLKACMIDATNGNYDISCDIESDNEFGDLSKCFNEMMQIINDTNERQILTQKQLEANETQLIEHNKHVEELAYTDGLTKLYNRMAFMSFAQKALDTTKGSFDKHAVLFIDLDDFKNVNDTLGHDFGDELLIQMANQLRSCTKEGDILARTGGDEFLIFKNHISTMEDVEETVQALMNITKRPFRIKDETLQVSLSLGISMFPKNGLSLTELIKTADIAMYCAKTAGKNNYRYFTSQMADDIDHKNDIIAVLQQAIKENELFLMYQPQADVHTGKIIGYEALMRLNSAELGMVSPAEFIPVAEENGLINELGDWALFEACAFNMRLMNEGFDPIIVSVNVSTAQLSGNHLIETLKRVEIETGMPLRFLEIEITESILMNDFNHNLDLIHQIKELGAKISLDDFGTGYSSFNYLTQIPINTLKIDKSFIDGICNNEKDRYIADSIISLAHKMKIRVIAEGVEDGEQLRILQEQMCDVLQGYYFSKPVTENKFIRLLEKY